MTDSNSKIWLRQDDEGPKRYLAFRIYRDLDHPRSMMRAWEEYKEVVNRVQRPSKPKRTNQSVPGSFRKWSKEHNWQERVIAYDRELDKELYEARAAALREGHEELTEHIPDLVKTAVRMALNGDKYLIKELLNKAGFGTETHPADLMTLEVKQDSEEKEGNNEQDQEEFLDQFLGGS